MESDAIRFPVPRKQCVVGEGKKRNALANPLNAVNRFQNIKLLCKKSNLGHHTDHAKAVRVPGQIRISISEQAKQMAQIRVEEASGHRIEIKLNSSYSRGKSSATSAIAFQTEEERASAKEKTRQRIKQTHTEGAAEQHAARPEHSIRVLQHQICSVLSKRNTLGCEWLNDVKPETAHQSQT
ncbi:hypothetical protein TNCV_3820161 [Trichonephila clavipes]|uniref:Uncharacterized protein n=1 Tax=Trichonephila clavipes TaxID=2585209 RepID=A0A8X6UPJ2_TRICX|nr:hypothetical protein TNCV_3820161 [Trichonephila clavipes]